MNNNLTDADTTNDKPHVYSDAVVSAPLITWFGLPTLIELEQPTTTSSSSTSVVAADDQQQGGDLLIPSISEEGDYDEGGRGLLSLTRTRSSSNFDEEEETIYAYTYRARRKLMDNPIGSFNDTEDRHQLLLYQNPDGTYSDHATPAAQGNRDEDRPKVVAEYHETDHLLLDKQQLRDAKNRYTTSISLDTVINLEVTLEKMDDGTLPPHIHPYVPDEILNTHYLRTTPALKLWPLAVLVFYNVSGGPFGIEPSIRAGGNLYAILGFIILPFVWSIPEALVTAELGAAFQDPSAGTAWVEHAFGEDMGGMCGILAWVSGATDNAIYPTLFMEYVASVAGWDKDDFGGMARFVSLTCITILLAMLNYAGLEFVGNTSLVICVIAMSPFVIMTIVGAPQVVPSRWFQLPETETELTDLQSSTFDDDYETSPGPLPLLTLGGILWRPFLNNMFWNLNSFDNAGSFAGETSNVKTTYPRGIFIGVVMVALGYLVPLLVAVGATDYSQAEWVDGHLGVVAVDIGGQWLGAWMVFAAGISNIAMFEAEMSSDAFKIMGMAERGYLPKCFEARSKYGTPTAGILTNTIVIIAFSCADFGQLLELLNCTYAISVLLEYAAFVKLRLYHKELQRPYRIPIPDWASILLVFPPSLGIVCIFATSNWWVYAFSTGAVLFSYTLSKLSGLSKRQGLFAPLPPQKSHEGIRR